MKSLIMLSLTLFLSNCNNKAELRSTDSNSKNEIQVEGDSVYTVVEEMPRFPGCEDRPKAERKTCADQKMLQYVHKNLVLKPINKEQDIITTFVVTFIIEKDGSTSNIEVLKGKNYANFIEIIKKMPLWKPGIHKGIAKRVRINFPMKINYQ